MIHISPSTRSSNAGCRDTSHKATVSPVDESEVRGLGFYQKAVSVLFMAVHFKQFTCFWKLCSKNHEVPCLRVRGNQTQAPPTSTNYCPKCCSQLSQKFTTVIKCYFAIYETRNFQSLLRGLDYEWNGVLLVILNYFNAMKPFLSLKIEVMDRGRAFQFMV